MNKQKKFKQSKRQVQTSLQSSVNYFSLSDLQLLILTVLVALAYFVYSFASDGFYQHDEIGHFFNMQDFWTNPNSILSNWAKPGYKLLYALPILGGIQVVTFTNCLFAAASCFIVYRLAEKEKLKYPLLAFLLLACQPMWIQIAHRNYSEIPTAFIYLLALFFFQDKKYILAALIISFSCFIRQESYFIAFAFGLFLLFRKQWLAFITLGIFPLLHGIWGALSSGDPLFLVNMVLKTSGSYATLYPRQGGDHYFLMSITVFGAVATTLFVLYFAVYSGKKFKLHYGILALFGIFFMEHVIFNTKFLNFGPSTGGNLRYLTTISPFLALIGFIALEKYFNLEKKAKTKVILILSIYLFIVLLFMTYKHNNIVLIKDQRDILPFVFSLGTVLVVLVTMQKTIKIWLISTLLILNMCLAVKPFPLSEEDIMLKNTALFLEKDTDLFKKQVWARHTLVAYFGQNLKTTNKFNKDNLDQIPKGDLIVWESHYLQREIDYRFFTENAQVYKAVYYKQGSRFAVIVFEKL